MDTLEERREYLSLKFARKCFENKQMKTIFSLNDKTHPMDIRKYENFKVQYSNTKRLKKSAIYAKTAQSRMKITSTRKKRR